MYLEDMRGFLKIVSMVFNTKITHHNCDPKQILYCRALPRSSDNTNTYNLSLLTTPFRQHPNLGLLLGTLNRVLTVKYVTVQVGDVF